MDDEWILYILNCINIPTNNLNGIKNKQKDSVKPALPYHQRYFWGNKIICLNSNQPSFVHSSNCLLAKLRPSTPAIKRPASSNLSMLTLVSIPISCNK